MAEQRSAAKPFWDVERPVGDVRKNNRGAVIRVSQTEKDNRKYVDVRVFYPGRDNGMRPGKGIALPSEIAGEVAGYILQASESLRG
ncbi:MAG: transcriptional coactivator p15/PC4 family protein [Limnochordales bacterium]